MILRQPGYFSEVNNVSTSWSSHTPDPSVGCAHTLSPILTFVPYRYSKMFVFSPGLIGPLSYWIFHLPHLSKLPHSLRPFFAIIQQIGIISSNVWLHPWSGCCFSFEISTPVSKFTKFILQGMKFLFQTFQIHQTKIFWMTQPYLFAWKGQYSAGDIAGLLAAPIFTNQGFLTVEKSLWATWYNKLPVAENFGHLS